MDKDVALACHCASVHADAGRNNPMMPRLGIVLVNWNRWAVTIEALESLRRATVPVQLVVVDNGSDDASIERIVAWAQGRQISEPAAPQMAHFSTPPGAKPITHVCLDAAAAVATAPGAAWLTVIDAGANLGFAGGNNLGLRHLLQNRALDFFWLLNNDTVVEPDAPAALLATLDATPNVGMCGTVVRFYFKPDTVQALNGSSFSQWTGISRGIGLGQPATQAFDAAEVTRKTGFVLGASLAASRAFLETIGLMEESYFLYYEEVDWMQRNAGRFTTAFADRAIVYHKEGGSIGSSSVKGARSSTSDYYLLRARLKFVTRHLPHLLPLHWLLAIMQIGHRLARGRRDKAVVLTRALLGRPLQA